LVPSEDEVDVHVASVDAVSVEDVVPVAVVPVAVVPVAPVAVDDPVVAAEPVSPPEPPEPPEPPDGVDADASLSGPVPAYATPGVVATAMPTPRETASAPTRPTYLA
jgi:hypothetical protein